MLHIRVEQGRDDPSSGSATYNVITTRTASNGRDSDVVPTTQTAADASGSSSSSSSDSGSKAQSVTKTYRFSELLNIHQQLVSIFGERVSRLDFPRKTLLTSAKTVRERVDKFQRYLSILASHELIADSFPFRSALGVYDGVVYMHTFGCCPICTAAEQRRITWLPARVVDRDGQAVLDVLCDRHGCSSTLICRDSAAFRRIVKVELLVGGTHTASFAEDNDQPVDEESSGMAAEHEPFDTNGHQRAHALRLQGGKFCVFHSPPTIAQFARVVAAQRHLTAVRDVPLYGASGFTTEEEMQHMIGELATQSPSWSTPRILIRLQGKTATDMMRLNALVLASLQHIGRERIALQLTPDRLATVCRLQNTAFLSPRVYPCLKYFLRRGEEDTCRMELIGCLAELCHFSDMHVAVELCVERPLPRLDTIMETLRRHKAMVRVIQITLARPLPQIRRAVSALQRASSTPSTPVYSRSSSRTASPARSSSGATIASAGLSSAFSGLSLSQPGTPTKDGSQIRLGPSLPNVVNYLDLVDMVCRAFEDSPLEQTDFFTPLLTTALEPILMLEGYGRYLPNETGLSGCCAFIFDTEDDDLVSLARVFRIDALLDNALPLLQSCRAANYSNTACLQAALKMKKLVGSALTEYGKRKFPFLTSLPLDGSTVDGLSSLMGRGQIIHVRRKVDMASIDATSVLHSTEGDTVRDELLKSVHM